MSVMSVRLPESLHKNAKKIARDEQISINQLVANALSEKISAILTEKYLEERAKMGNKAKYYAVLKKVPDADIDEKDEI